jgi:uncharacterized protein (DUF952 family)
METIIYKVIRHEHTRDIVNNGYIPDQSADINCGFIHACDLETVPVIIDKFFKDEYFAVLKLRKNILEKHGFKVVWESNRPGGQHYWHIYRGKKYNIPWQCIDETQTDAMLKGTF